MNTILITGTAKMTASNNVEYDVILWASKEGEQLQVIRTYDTIFRNHSELWKKSKIDVSYYFGKSFKFYDGAYTQYLDHLILI